MKILSIDLDYCMSPSIQLYNNAFFDNNPLTRWNDLFNNTDFKENHLVIDQSNLLFCFDTFLKSLKYCDSVSFGYEHDAILFNIENFDNIELINIDHHDDVLGGSYITDSVYNPELCQVLLVQQAIHQVFYILFFFLNLQIMWGKTFHE